MKKHELSKLKIKGQIWCNQITIGAEINTSSNVYEFVDTMRSDNNNGLIYVTNQWNESYNSPQLIPSNFIYKIEIYEN